MTGFKGAVLRLHLLTGGLRIEQLVNLKTSDIIDDTITLHDIKGRSGGSSPRPYTTPLIPCAVQSLALCNSVGVHALSTDSGITHLSAITFSNWSREAADSKIPNFTAKRIRSGVETLLAKLKFSKDLRGRLQSHGISGLQDKHYDGHDYIDEKREMLEALFKVLEVEQTRIAT
jgi:integrase